METKRSSVRVLSPCLLYQISQIKRIGQNEYINIITSCSVLQMTTRDLNGVRTEYSGINECNLQGIVSEIG